MRVVVTGAAGFIGRHVVGALRRMPNVTTVVELRRDNFAATVGPALDGADVVFHLAGVNRPTDPAEFETGNLGLTERICTELEARGAKPLVVLASSVQAQQDNPYGRSKRAAEEALTTWSRRHVAPVVIFRLRNVFGKWCRPNYNSVVATFCHNIAHDLPIVISDPLRELKLIYIDDVVAALLGCLTSPPGPTCECRDIVRSYRTTLGCLADLVRSFRASRQTLLLPSFDDEFTRLLYVTYLSYLDGREFSYALQQRSDARGTLAEFMKSAAFGQIFVSRTNPGVTRGNHYHHSKTEKFLVVEGEGLVRFRAINGTEIIEHRVNGREYRVVDIPPGYTHSIENIGASDLVTLFWASEVFDPQRPDTIMAPVLPPA
jgi:UDP-2-acetamido-2,6-beta-L-arabino-hexul-4-ose reductase